MEWGVDRGVRWSHLRRESLAGIVRGRLLLPNRSQILHQPASVLAEEWRDMEEGVIRSKLFAVWTETTGGKDSTARKAKKLKNFKFDEEISHKSFPNHCGVPYILLSFIPCAYQSSHHIR